MAQRVTVELVDDLTGKKADETVTFSLDGKDYAIDLSNANAEKFRADMADYVAHSRRPSSGGNGKPRGTRTTMSRDDRERNAAIRDFAKQRGMKVSDRGRIPQDIIDEYERDSANR